MSIAKTDGSFACDSGRQHERTAERYYGHCTGRSRVTSRPGVHSRLAHQILHRPGYAAVSLCLPSLSNGAWYFGVWLCTDTAVQKRANVQAEECARSRCGYGQRQGYSQQGEGIRKGGAQRTMRVVSKQALLLLWAVQSDGVGRGQLNSEIKIQARNDTL